MALPARQWFPVAQALEALLFHFSVLFCLKGVHITGGSTFFGT